MPLCRDNNISPKIILQAKCSQVLDNLLHCECDRVVVRVYLFVVTICSGPFPSFLYHWIRRCYFWKPKYWWYVLCLVFSVKQVLTCCFNFFTFSSYPILISQIIGEAIRISHPTHTHMYIVAVFPQPIYKNYIKRMFFAYYFALLAYLHVSSRIHLIIVFLIIFPYLSKLQMLCWESPSQIVIYLALSFSLLSRMFLQTLFPCTRVCVLLWCPPQNYLFSAKT